MFVWERAGWPELTFDAATLVAPLADARLRQGQLLGRMSRLGFEIRAEAQVEALADDLVKSWEIEGEVLDRRSVRSSLARRLGVRVAGVAPRDREVDGLVEMLVDATANFQKPVTAKRLFGWHAALFPTGFSGVSPVRVGGWRDDREGPMQVVSGAIGRERVHFQAPPATRVAREMRSFLRWFEAPERGVDPVIRAGLAHLWFVTIHPFEDGNGRIARAITDLALARAEVSAQRFYSLSSAILAERAGYYDALEGAQRGGLDVTGWLSWFLGCFGRAVDGAESVLGSALAKADYWQRHSREVVSERQRKVLNRVLDGFEGKLTAKKWAALGKCSVPTAQRDLNDLVDRGMLVRGPGGSKNTCYELPP